jgi:hypothetical protein
MPAQPKAGIFVNIAGHVFPLMTGILMDGDITA